MKELKRWYFTFRHRDRYANRYHIISATSEDQARKQMVNLFKNEWENFYTEDSWNDESVPKRLPMSKYTELSERERSRQAERDGRIRYKIYVEREKE